MYGTASTHPLSHLKGFHASAITAELKSVYETKALALSTIKN
jgi:hypothetical protein